MNVLVRTSWHLVLRVTLCYLVFYSMFYFAISFVNGMSLHAMVLGMAGGGNYGMAPSDAQLWLKFCSELAARLSAAAMLAQLGVPGYRFAVLDNDAALYTNFTYIFPRWATPALLVALVTAGGQTLPLAHYLLPWVLFHLALSYAMVHYLMCNVADARRLRLIEER